MKKSLSLLFLVLSFEALSSTYFQEYTSPSGGTEKVKLRTEAVDWVAKNIQGLELLNDKKLVGLHYITSLLFERLDTLDSKRVIYDELYSQMKPGDVSYSPFFVKEGLKLIVLGNNDRVTDLPEYAHWRGRTVEDVFGYRGDMRSMDNIDGEATRNTCLLKENRIGNFPVGSSNTFYHEFGHFIHMTTLSKLEFLQVEKLYLEARAKNHFLDNYAAQSVHEYFAQGLEAYVAEKKTSKDRMGAYTKSGRKDLLKIDPELHAFIAKLMETY